MDFNFFKAMRLRIRAKLMKIQSTKQAVPEGCRGDVLHFGTNNASSNDIPTIEAAVSVPKAPIAPTTPIKITPEEPRKESSPPLGGVEMGIGLVAATDPETAHKIELLESQRIAAEKSKNHVPYQKRKASDLGTGRPTAYTRLAGRFEFEGHKHQGLSSPYSGQENVNPQNRVSGTQKIHARSIPKTNIATSAFILPK